MKSDVCKLMKLIEDKGLSLPEVITFIRKSSLVPSEPKLRVDYIKTIEQYIADGDYDKIDSEINAKNFPISQEVAEEKVEIRAKLFHFNRIVSSDEAMSEMDKAGYRPAILTELLALGFLFPGLQEEFPIIALGSIWHDPCPSNSLPPLSVRGRIPDISIRVPCLCGIFSKERELMLDWADFDWWAHFRFLGVQVRA